MQDNFDNFDDLPDYEQEARDFLLNPANFEFEGEEYEDEFLEEEEMLVVDEYPVELHHGEHPVLPGQDPRAPPYMLLQLYDGAAPEPRVEEQFEVQDRPGIFEFVAGLVAQGIRMREYVPAPPTVLYEFVLQQAEVKEEDWVCSICLDSTEENSDKTCLHPAGCHTFHDACLQRWLGRTPTCPTCRAAVTPMLAREKH
jgi:hypothetical protein